MYLCNILLICYYFIEIFKETRALFGKKYAVYN